MVPSKKPKTKYILNVKPRWSGTNLNKLVLAMDSVSEDGVIGRHLTYFIIPAHNIDAIDLPHKILAYFHKMELLGQGIALDHLTAVAIRDAIRTRPNNTTDSNKSYPHDFNIPGIGKFRATIRNDQYKLLRILYRSISRSVGWK